MDEIDKEEIDVQVSSQTSAPALGTIKFQEHEEENSEEDPPELEEIIVPRWIEPDSDEEEDQTQLYDVNEAWTTMFNLPTCRQVMIKSDIQKQLNIVIGINVSQQFPWKQIPYKYIRDYLLDYVDEPDLVFKAMEVYDQEETVLIGYAPLLTQNKDDASEGDPFIFFMSTNDGKTALSLIRNIEKYEGWVLKKRFIKKPRRWVTMGSEDEVNLTLQQRYQEQTDVEIQSIYPLTIPASSEFSFRKVDDVRDGYVELVPDEGMEFQNVTRKRITVAIQSAPQLASLEQQTDPTFPTNAWAQYLYEIDEEDDALDDTTDEEEKSAHSGSASPEPEDLEPVVRDPVKLSKNVKFLLRMLEFNQIDMYRNDYPHIAEKAIDRHTCPYLEEMFCFAKIEKSFERYVCAIDWYPSLSGLIVTSYTYSTPATVETANKHIDVIQRAVLQQNPVLMWSFSDNLNCKLEFEAPFEVTALSFCPHNKNLLFGGGKNGQVIIWDLQGRAEKLDCEEMSTAEQTRYHSLMSKYLNCTIQFDEDSIISPASISALETSQKDAITSINWLHTRLILSNLGKVTINPQPKTVNKFFMTTSADGTIAFWDVDAMADINVGDCYTRGDLPKELCQSESSYKHKVLKPVFQVQYNEPLSSCFANYSLLKCIVSESNKKRRGKFNYRLRLDMDGPDNMTEMAILATLYGRIERLYWLEQEDAEELPRDCQSFACIHDGPVVSLRKNPFYQQVFVTIGRNVFAVWKEDYPYTPILWRKCVCDLTAVAWSENRAGVFYLTRIDGNFEVWDLLARDDAACLDDTLGGGVVTAISEHRPNEPVKLLGIGDYNSSLRMVKLPEIFFVPLTDEEEKFREYIVKEEARKKNIQQWEHDYYLKNKDIIDAKRKAEVKALKEMERMEKDNAVKAVRAAKEEEERRKANQPSTDHLPYTERMRRQWDALNLSRMTEILMKRMRVKEAQLELDTALEKTRLRYEAAKREEFIKAKKRVNEEMADVRSRILPTEKIDTRHTELIKAGVEDIMQTVQTYEAIEAEANELLGGMTGFDGVDYNEYLKRGAHRRRMLNQSVGGNPARLLWYEGLEGTLDECNWGYESFLNATAEIVAKEEARLANIAAENTDFNYPDSCSEVEPED